MKKPNRTENDILFNCTHDILRGKSTMRTDQEVLSFLRDFKKEKGVENNNNFSKDNFCGVACYLNMFWRGSMDELPVVKHYKWKHHHASSFDWLMFFFYAKYPLIGFIFLPIISLSMIISCARVWRVNKNGVKHISTSGKILVFIRLRSFNMPITEYFCNKIINGHKDLQGWLTVFSIYHKDARPHIYKAFIDWELKGVSE